jgi:hypothetical protein
LPDTDKDGIPDVKDTDDDNDGIADADDTDDDGDGVPDTAEVADADGDGVPDDKDADDDNDGVPDAADQDDDGDGVSDKDEIPTDGWDFPQQPSLAAARFRAQPVVPLGPHSGHHAAACSDPRLAPPPPSRKDRQGQTEKERKSEAERL